MELALKTVMLRETASWTQTAPLDKNVATAVNVYQARHCVHCLQSSPWLFLFLYFSALFLSSVFALTILPVQCTRLSNGVVWELYSNSNRQPGPDEHISYDLSIINWSRSCLMLLDSLIIADLFIRTFYRLKWRRENVWYVWKTACHCGKHAV